MNLFNGSTFIMLDILLFGATGNMIPSFVFLALTHVCVKVILVV